MVPFPLAVVPPMPPVRDRASFRLPQDAIVVLVSLNLASSFERKNPLAAIAAFRAAFGKRLDRILVLKIGNPDHFPADFIRIVDAAGGALNIRFDIRSYPAAGSLALTAAADIVMSLHRAEGFGLVLAEAMLLGKPVIATGWSGNMGFMDADSAALVGYRLVPVEDPRQVYRDWYWAEPDVDEAVAHLRRLAEDAEARAALGARGKALASERLGIGSWPTRCADLVWRWAHPRDRTGRGERFWSGNGAGSAARHASRCIWPKASPNCRGPMSCCRWPRGRRFFRDAPAGGTAEFWAGSRPIHCDLVVDTYTGLPGFLLRLATAPFAIARLARGVAALRPDLAICAQPGPLDLLMAAALHRSGVRFVVVVHDADAHPGDGFPLQMWLQRLLCGRAERRGRADRPCRRPPVAPEARRHAGPPLIRLTHPPMRYRFTPRAADSGTFRLLSFGRLLPYKGLDLLAESLALPRPAAGLVVRVVGSGPESRELTALRALPGVTVENRWVPETEVGALFSWADAVVLPYREASQSGVAAVALAAHRYVIATNVGGLTEQLRDEPMAILCRPDAESLASACAGRWTGRRVRAGRGDRRGSGWRDMAQSLLDQISAVGVSRPSGAK